MSTTILSSDELGARDAYVLMTSLVAPRPIAWVSTRSVEGVENLAPFSYFQAVCSAPPTVVVSFGSKGDGRPKDSLRNILDTGTFTISHVGEQHLHDMNASAAEYPSDVSEWDALGLAALASEHGAPPRVQGSAAALECRMQQAIPLGVGKHGAPSATLVIARVLRFVVRTDMLERDERGRLRPVDPSALRGVGRLGGIAYTPTASPVEVSRPPRPAE